MLEKEIYKSFNMNTFKISTDRSKANGTCLRGYIDTTYSNLVQHFGKPEHTSGKTNALWLIEFDDGLVATIYDWKLNTYPTGHYNWHIGAHKGIVVSRLANILGEPYMETPF